MRRLLYLHDGKSIYDVFFLNFLKKHFDILFAGFSPAGEERVRTETGLPSVLLRDMPFELPVHDMGRAILSSPLRAAAVRKLASRVDWDAALAGWATTYGLYSAAAGLDPFGLLAWGSDVLIHPKYFPLRALAGWSVRKARKVFVDSGVQADAVRRLGCAEGKAVSFPWIDLGWAAEVRRGRQRYRRDYDVADKTVIMFNRSHDPVYLPLTLIESLPGVLRKHQDVQVLVAGRGKLTLAMKSMVGRLGLAGQVRFLGYLRREELMHYVAASDIYVSTSMSDGTSASLLEAMALGLAPVVSSIPGNREWIEDGVNGLLFPPGNSSALARALEQLLVDDGRRASISKAALSTASRRVDWEKNSRLFLEELNGMIEG